MGLPYPTADASADRLKRTGWRVMETSVFDQSERIWVVMTYRSGRLLSATGATQAEAWHRACLPAGALGMLRRTAACPRHGGIPP